MKKRAPTRSSKARRAEGRAVGAPSQQRGLAKTHTHGQARPPKARARAVETPEKAAAAARTARRPPQAPSREPGAFPIVGIGASAGGLEALELFLKHVPRAAGWRSSSSSTSTRRTRACWSSCSSATTAMPVVQVKDRQKVEPDHVYVIPPNKDMSILHGVLHLLPPASPRGLRLPIDFFFRSLAQDQQERSIGVILSGMGSDGTLGLRAIKEKGGGALVQALNGQIRRHAAQRHRCRAGGHRRPRRGAAGAGSSPIGKRTPLHRASRAPRSRTRRRARWRRSSSCCAAHTGQRLFSLQAKHNLPPHRAPHGDAPDR